MSKQINRAFCRIAHFHLVFLGVILWSGNGVLAHADVCPNAQYRTGASALLPDCRAYEQVSPVDKSSGSVGYTNNNTSAGQSAREGVSENGEVFAYWGYASFAEPHTGEPASYKATRSTSGWHSIQWSPAPVYEHPDLEDARSMVVGSTPDLSIGFATSFDRLDPLDEDPINVLGGWQDIYALRPGAAPEWISRPDGSGPDAAAVNAYYVGSSEDASKVFFQTTEAMVAQAAGNVSGTMLYARSNGHTELVGVDDSGQEIGTCGATLANPPRAADTGQSTGEGEISTDGSRVVLSAPAVDSGCTEPAQLYLRDGTHTIQVSRSQRGEPDPGGTRPATFQGAAVDDSVVYFSSAEALTDSALPGGGEYLYRYEVSKGELTEIAGRMASIIALSRDGEHLFFENEEGAYSYDEGVVKQMSETEPSPLDAVATPDGEVMVLLTSVGLTSFDTHGAREVYRFDARDGSVLCVSCNSAGSVPLGDAELGGDLSRPSTTQPHIRNVTEDGREVFFETRDALVPADVNGTSDVYEWSASDGIHLLSDGVNGNGTGLLDASPDGRDVFIVTTASLLPQDVDGGDYDIYDARVNGGFPPAAAAAVSCEGEACQGPPTTGPTLPNAASSAVSGSGTPVVVAPRASVDALSLVSQVLKGSSVVLGVRASGVGRLRVSGAGLVSVTRTTSAGVRTYSLKARLSTAELRVLKRRRALTIKGRVQFTPALGSTVTKSFSLRVKI